MRQRLVHDYTIMGRIWCSDETYAYGYTSGSGQYSRIRRYTTDNSFTDLHDFGAGKIITAIWATSTPGMIFALIKNIADLHYLYKSTDFGETFGAISVLDVGWCESGWESNGYTPVHIPNVRALYRSFCEDKENGNLYFSEYNVSSGRVSGATNDQVRFLRSTDDGDSWQVVAKWNTNGTTRQISHLHGVVQDPYTGDLVLMSGDTDAQTGFLIWDRTSEIVSNQSPVGNWTVSNDQKYRAVDMLFFDDNIVWGCDTNSSDKKGIWRSNKDFSGATLVDQSVADYVGHICFYALKDKQGNCIISDFLDASESPVDMQKKFWTSKDGENWTIGAVYGLRADTASDRPGAALFVFGDRIYFSDVGAAGKCVADAEITTSMVFSNARNGRYALEYPSIIEPTYYVAKDGSDANNGFNSSSAWATVNKALTNDSICKGANVIICQGNYAETSSLRMDWDVSLNDGTQLHVPTTIHGDGKNKTVIWKNTSTGSYFVGAELAESKVIFNDLSIYNPENGENLFYVDQCSVEAYDCRIGRDIDANGTYQITLVTNSNSKFKGKGCEFLRTRENYVIGADAAGEIDIDLCIFKNGSIYSTGIGAVLSVTRSIFDKYSGRGINIGATSNLQPVIKNNIFIGLDGTNPIKSTASGVTETNVDYNFYTHPLSGVTDGGHSVTAVDPLFLSESNCHLQPTSPCLNTGTVIAGITTDLDGNQYPSPNGASIGPYEDYPLPAEGVGPWSHFNGTTPPFALSDTSPANLLEVKAETNE